MAEKALPDRSKRVCQKKGGAIDWAAGSHKPEREEGATVGVHRQHLSRHQLFSLDPALGAETPSPHISTGDMELARCNCARPATIDGGTDILPAMPQMAERTISPPSRGPPPVLGAEQ